MFSFILLVFKRSFGKGSVSLRETGNYYSRGNRESRTKRVGKVDGNKQGISRGWHRES